MYLIFKYMKQKFYDKKIYLYPNNFLIALKKNKRQRVYSWVSNKQTCSFILF